MLGLAEVRDWLKTFGIGEHFYIGKLDNKKDKSIGIYQRKTSGPPTIPVGGLQNKKYDVKPISVLVHWNNNANDTEQASFSLFEKILNISDLMIGQTHINYVRLMVPEPQDVGTDDKGVYERVIWFDLYYER
ncbi:minor capsid protein [Anaerovorax odorimutans]|uniref:Minor capsid protein n=1 Tax=Anaerovorax odorimutans TaxID=109327 RepID=A0ABT1RTB7_9FIRM|nr:minor capsid protein [Anaerovorax odorimutans]MCQ4638451.1 minor capsid protein [Anaerovorax odorimutans]